MSRCIIAVSDANRRTAISRRVAPRSKIVTVHNGVPDSPYRAKPAEGTIPRIAMVARFVPQKNQALLIEAAARLTRPVVLTFVGDGPIRQQAEALAATCPSHVKVEFLGQRFDVAEILARCNVFVLSTNWEGFPISILEAMRAGLPVIATDVDGVREAVFADNGLLVGVKNRFELTSAMEQLISDPQLRQHMGAQSRAIYEERFSLPAMLQKTASVYAAALGQHADVSAELEPVPRWAVQVGLEQLK